MLGKLQDWLLRVWVRAVIGPEEHTALRKLDYRATRATYTGRDCQHCPRSATQHVQVSVRKPPLELDTWTCDKHVSAWMEDL